MSRLVWCLAIATLVFALVRRARPSIVEAVNAECDPSYPTLCIPVGAPDRDCADVAVRGFPVTGYDRHGFDGDGDGVGCERY